MLTTEEVEAFIARHGLTPTMVGPEAMDSLRVRLTAIDLTPEREAKHLAQSLVVALLDLNALAAGKECPGISEVIRARAEAPDRDRELYEKFVPPGSEPPKMMTVDVEIPGEAPYQGVKVLLDGEDMTRRLHIHSIEMEPLDGPQRHCIVKLRLKANIHLRHVKAYIPREDLEWAAAAHGYRLEPAAVAESEVADGQ